MIALDSTVSTADRASSCVAFLESMRSKFGEMLRTSGGPTTGEYVGRSSPEERARAVELCRDGMHPDEIAIEMSRSTQWVRSVVLAEGLTWWKKKPGPKGPGKRSVMERAVAR